MEKKKPTEEHEGNIQVSKDHTGSKWQRLHSVPDYLAQKSMLTDTT